MTRIGARDDPLYSKTMCMAVLVKEMATYFYIGVSKYTMGAGQILEGSRVAARAAGQGHVWLKAHLRGCCPWTPRRRASRTAVIGPPIVWLASDETAGVHDERIVAAEFERWLRDRNGRP
jgi:hypothetical protein